MRSVRQKHNHLVVVFDRISQLLQSAGDALENGDKEKAVQCTNKSVSLLEIMGYTGSEEEVQIVGCPEISDQIQIASTAMKQLVLDLQVGIQPSGSASGFHDKSADDMPVVGGNEIPPSSSTAQRSLPFRKGFCDIVGYNAVKQQLYENVVLPLTLPDGIKAQLFGGIRSGSGNVLLYGPPGTGKTALCQAAAAEADALLINVKPSDILSKYQGESERFLRKVFDDARAVPRAVIFFDEFDSIATNRGSMDDGIQARRLLSELLLQLTQQKQINQAEAAAAALSSKGTSQSQPVVGIVTGEVQKQQTLGDDSINIEGESLQLPFEAEDCSDGSGATDDVMPGGGPSIFSSGASSSDASAAEDCMMLSTSIPSGTSHSGNVLGRGLVIVAGTNRLGDIDEAVVRRFESRVHVGWPCHTTRVDMVKYFLRGIESMLADEDYENVATMTDGWSGSEIETLCRQAAMYPVRSVLQYNGNLDYPRAILVDADVAETKPTNDDETISSQPRSPPVSMRCHSSSITIHVRPVSMADFEQAYATILERGGTSEAFDAENASEIKSTMSGTSMSCLGRGGMLMGIGMME